jgi:hypothetical protein
VNGRRLLDRLERFQLDAVTLEEAKRFFDERGDPGRARWMSLERTGYGVTTEAHNLRDVVGNDVPEDVIASILRCRLRRGQLQVGPSGPVIHWPHFFVETLETLRDWRNRVVHVPAGDTVVIELTRRSDPLEPRSLMFSPTVFIDVANAATLEIADAVRKATAS